MNGAIATAFVEIRPDTTGFGPRVQAEVQPEARRLGATIGQTIGGALLSAGIGSALVASLREADEARDIAAQTAAAIRSTGGAANVTAQQVGELSERLSEQIAVDDDLIQQSANLLLTFTRVRNEVGEGNDIFDRSVAITQDMAAALGTDATSAAMQLGKALNDPISGLTALGRAGVQFTDQQKEQIRTMVDAGDQLGAQRIILAELETQVAGSAAAQASGLDRITVATGNLKESIGGALAPVVEQMVPIVERAVDAFEGLPDAAQTLLVVGGATAGILGPLGRTIDGYRSLTGAISGAAGQAGKLGSVLAGLGKGGIVIGGIIAAAAGLERLVNGADDARASIEDMAEATDEALVRTIDGILAATALFGGSAESVFQGLADEGDAGLGVLIRYRDEMAALGRETATLDAIISAESESQQRANATREAAAEAIDGLGGAVESTGGAFDRAAGDVERLSEALGDVNDEIATAFDRMSSVEEAEAAFRGTIRSGFAEAQSLITGDADDFEQRDAFQQFLIDARNDALELASALGAEGVGADEITRRVQGLIEEAATLAEDFGLTTEEADDLREALGLLPNQIDLIVGGNLAQAREDAEALLQSVLNLALVPINTILSVVPGTVPAVANPTAGGGIVIQGGINITSPEPTQAGTEVVRELERTALLTGQGPRRPI